MQEDLVVFNDQVSGLLFPTSEGFVILRDFEAEFGSFVQESDGTTVFFEPDGIAPHVQANGTELGLRTTGSLALLDSGFDRLQSFRSLDPGRAGKLGWQS
jgi:hypothetical protein